MLLLRRRLLVPSSQMQPRIMQMRLHVAVAVKPQRRVRDRALGAHTARLRDGRMQLGAGGAVAVGVPDGGTGEIQERAPGAAAAPAGIVCFIDGAEVGFQPLSAFFAEGRVGDGVGEPVFGGEGGWWRGVGLVQEGGVKGDEVGVALGDGEGAQGEAEGDVVDCVGG